MEQMVELAFERYETPGEILKYLFLKKKEQLPIFSLQYVCDRTNISSRGHLSDLLNGRRKVPPSLGKDLCRVFGLKGVRKKWFELLIDLNKSKDPIQRQKIKKQIDRIKKQVQSNDSALTAGDYDPFVFMKVFASFGIFKKKK